jgi:hypothetical protein
LTLALALVILLVGRMHHMPNVKIAISLQKALFEQVKALAREMNVSP